MPRLDGTGPQGRGVKSGRGMGPCGQGKNNKMGFGQGRLSGRYGSKNNWSKTDLEEYRSGLEKELEEIKEVLVKKG